MRIIFVLIITIAFDVELFAQGTFYPRPSDKPGWSPLIARLLSLNHKASSEVKYKNKITSENFSLTQSQSIESINVWVEYYREESIGKKEEHSFHPPKKLMDFHLIYSYHYFIPFVTDDLLNQFLPQISLDSSDQLIQIKIINHYLEKEKIRSDKFDKKEIDITTKDSKLIFSIMKGICKSISIVEILIDIKSYDFSIISPAINANGNFERDFTLSIPAIFVYQYPVESNNFELLTVETKTFDFLNFNRESKDYYKVIDVFTVDCSSLQWKVKTASEFTVQLIKLNLPPQIDIGVPREEMISNKY